MTDGSQTYRFDYDDQGNVRTYTAGNGSGSTFNYDHANKIKDLVVGTSSGIILSEQYEYDQGGNRTAIKHESPTTGRITQTQYEYDANNQLTKEVFPLLRGTKTYTYDGFGNRTSVTTKRLNKTTTIEAQFNEGNQLVKFGEESLTYDANGNRTSDGKYKYTWNERDQIVAITKQGESDAFATYKYDENNRRIEKNVNGQVTRYFYDGDSINPLYEADGSGTVLRQYVYSISGTRLAMKTKGQTLYYHYNPRGDVVAMTDQNKEVVATYEYDSWGNVSKSDTKDIAADNPFGYAGYMYDKEIGMYYLIARYYNPNHGVFLSVDPDPGDEDDPVTMNGYTYGDNNPVMKIDPDGHWAYPSWGTTPMPYYNNRTSYAHFEGVKSGLIAVRDSYAGFVGVGNGVNKALTFGVGWAVGWKTSKNSSKNQIANLSPGQRAAKQQIIKNAVKSAAKGALFAGSKAVGGIGLIPDMVVYVDGYYKGYKKGYKDYKPKKTTSKKRGK
ncbi:RHS repeat-associated core domain-containing protein [Bacillus cereus group sp. TH153LC]|uniref:RHS repeat domain-containing protein n=1 Tax=Bacillus cereus group sp. TH153LC TaxID=3018059 RepID=UPI002FDAF83C